MASGFGRRFGSNKLLAEVDGVPLYHRAMAALAPVLPLSAKSGCW